MTRLILFGAAGRMGKEVEAAAQKSGDFEIVSRVDVSGADGCLPSLDGVTGGADAIVDFSHHAATKTLTDYAVEKKIPLLIATTGQTDEELGLIRAAAKTIPVFFAANYSLGIAALIHAAKAIVKLYPDADIEIVEKHHNQKLDAPSGTALALADSINEELNGEYEYVYDRSGRREKRPKKEIGISAVRGGSIVGDHDVIFAGMDEVITFSHTAYSRAVFAKGAISAAKFLAGKTPGMYDMSDVINSAI